MYHLNNIASLSESFNLDCAIETYFHPLVDRRIAHILHHWIIPPLLTDSHSILYTCTMSTLLSYVAGGCALFAIVAITLFTGLAHSIIAPFFWHPTTMALGFLFFMPQGVIAIVSKNSMLHGLFELAERKLQIEAHYWTQVRPNSRYFAKT